MRVVLGVVVVGSTLRVAHADREARITIAEGTAGGHAGAGAEVVFTDGPAAGAVIAHDGPCTLRARPWEMTMSAGANTITGTNDPISLPATPTNPRAKNKASIAAPAFDTGADLVVHAGGSPEIPAFTAFVKAPSALTGYTPPKSLSRDGTRLEWAPGTGGDIEIWIAATGEHVNDPVYLHCRVSDVGHFTVPPSTFALLPATHRRAFMVVARVAETQQMVGDVRITLEAMSMVGTGPVALETPERPSPPVHVPAFLGIGLGMGETSRLGNAPPSGGNMWAIEVGYPIARKLHLVFGFSSLSGNYLSKTPTYAGEERTSLGAGIRWTPFAARPTRMHSFPLHIFPGRMADIDRELYVEAIGGIAVRDQWTEIGSNVFDDQTSVSPMLDLAVGVGEFRGNDWMIGPEVREQLAYFAGHVARQAQVIIAVRLF